MKSLIPVEVTAQRWQRTHGAHPGAVAQYGPYLFRLWRWQKGCYAVSVTNEDTRCTVQRDGFNAGELPTEAAAKARAAEWFHALRQEDRAQGIRRFV